MGIIDDINNYSCKNYNLKENLLKTQQDSTYHQEGNVWNHTISVMENLLDDREYKTLDENQQKILLISALLHDIAKPFTTIEQDGRIKTPLHAKKGAIEARKIFYKYNFLEEIFGKVDFYMREQICSLIKYHGLPLFFWEKDNFQREIIKASLEVSINHIAILSKADAMGRICPYKQELLEKIKLFKEEANEIGCLNSPKQFLSDKSKLFYFLYGDNYLNYVPFDEDASTVYLLSGLPASGKSYYFEDNFAKLKNIKTICLDDIRKELKILPNANQGRIIQESKKRAKILLSNKVDFVWNATNTTQKVRQGLINLFANYNANVKIIYFETEYKNLIERNNKRESTVPETVINKMIYNLEVPKSWECMQLENIVF